MRSFFIGLLAICVASGLCRPADATESSPLAPTGELRVGLIASNPVLVTNLPDGALGGVSVDLAQALAKVLDVPLRLVPYDNPARYNESIVKNEWDIGLAARDPSRAEVLVFSEPFMEVDGGYVARPGLMMHAAQEADQPGIRIAVAAGSAPDVFLTRTLKYAEIEHVPGGGAAARAALESGRADLYADNLHLCYRIADELAGARVLDGRFNSVMMAISIPKANVAALPLADATLRQVKREGVIAQSIVKAGLRGVRPAP